MQIIPCISAMQAIIVLFVGFPVGLLVSFVLTHSLLVFSGAIAGTTVAGQSGVAGGWAFQLNFPTYLAMDQFGFLYIMDSANDRIMRWFPGASYGVPIISEPSMNMPRGLRIDPFGSLVVADVNMHRVLSFAMICRKTMHD